MQETNKTKTSEEVEKQALISVSSVETPAVE